MSILAVDTIQGQTTAANVKMPAGYVIQTVVGTSTTGATLGSNNTHVDSGLTATITPKYATSKVLVFHDSAIVYEHTHDYIMRLVRGSSVVKQINFYSAGSGILGNMTGAFQFLDSPATTNATTYKITNYKNQGSVYYNYNNEITSTSTLTLMEIAQ